MCANDLTTNLEIFGDAKVDVTPFQSKIEVISIVGGSRWCLKFLRKIFARIRGSSVRHSIEQLRELGAGAIRFLFSFKKSVYGEDRHGRWLFGFRGSFESLS